MDSELRKKLLILKERNRRKAEKFLLENNILFQECITSLEHAVILSKEKSAFFIKKIMSKFPFSEYGYLEWDKFNGKVYKNVSVTDIDKLINSEDTYIIVWDGNDVPCVLCDLKTIINSINDVDAVSFHTFLISYSNNIIIELINYNELILGIIE